MSTARFKVGDKVIITKSVDVKKRYEVVKIGYNRSMEKLEGSTAIIKSTRVVNGYTVYCMVDCMWDWIEDWLTSDKKRTLVRKEV